LSSGDPFGARSTLEVGGESFEIFRLDALQEKFDVARLPYALKVLLENLLRNGEDEGAEAVARWAARDEPSRKIAYRPARVLMQDFTGVPAIVDLAAMRDAMEELGADATKINLVIDHSIQVDVFAGRLAFERNGVRRRSTISRWCRRTRGR
jgi:aconitate hydratase